MKNFFLKGVAQIKNKEVKTICRFLFSGGVSTGIDFIIYMFLYGKLDPRIAKLISSGFALICSFFINRRWTFRYEKYMDFGIILKFIISQIVNIGTNTVVNYLVLLATSNVILSFIFATGCGMIINYLLQRFWVFVNERGRC